MIRMQFPIGNDAESDLHHLALALKEIYPEERPVVHVSSPLYCWIRDGLPFDSPVGGYDEIIRRDGYTLFKNDNLHLDEITYGQA